MLAEAELIEATSEALAAIGLDGTTIRLSDRRFWLALAADSGVPEASWDAFFIVLDKLDKIGWEGVRSELAGLGLSAAVISAVEEKIRGLEGVPASKLADALAEAVPGLAAPVISDLATTVACLDRLATERSLSWEFDPTLVRGMGYYTGQVFEVTHPDVSFSVAGGGRYDKMIGRSLGHDVPACGFSIGFERIVDLLAVQSRDAVAALVEPDVPMADALAVAREMRAESARARGGDGAPEREVRGAAEPAGGGGVQRVRGGQRAGRRRGARRAEDAGRRVAL